MSLSRDLFVIFVRFSLDVFGNMFLVQFVQRVLVIFMPAKYQPDYMFLRNVRISRVHLFTFIQSLCQNILALDDSKFSVGLSS